jgi:hypothetical protein
MSTKQKRKRSAKQRENDKIIRQIERLINNDSVKISWARERGYSKQIIEKTSVQFFLSLSPPKDFKISSLFYYIKHLPKLEKMHKTNQFEYTKVELPEYSDTNFLDDEDGYVLNPKTEKEFLNYAEEEE